jgi:hypothetical protein
MMLRAIIEGGVACSVRYASYRELKSTWKTLRNLS